MTILEKTELFRRLVDSVHFYRSRKNFYRRLLTRLSSYTLNHPIDFKFQHLEKIYLLPFNLSLVDVIDVRSFCNTDDHIIIRVYISQSIDKSMKDLYFKVYV